MRIIVGTLLTIWLLCPALASAAENPWYQIEMIVFAHHDDNAAQEEHWPDDVNLVYPDNLKTLFELTRLPQRVDNNFTTTLEVDTPDLLSILEAPEENTLAQQGGDLAAKDTDPTTASVETPIAEKPLAVTDNPLVNAEEPPPPLAFQKLDAGNEELVAAMGHLRRIDRYRPLFHATWQQPLQDRQRSPSILVNGGETYGEHFELEGTVKISVERYLHIDTDLWLHNFAPNFGQQATVQVPPLPNQLEKTTEDMLNPLLARFLNDNAHVVSRTVVLRESRRMRSGEIHYLDHPMMGVIVLVTPLERG